MTAQIKSFCTEFDFPHEATETLIETYKQLKATPLHPLFEGHVRLYSEDDASFSYSDALGAIRKISDKTGIEGKTLELLFFIRISEHCRELYVDAEIPLNIYKDSMTDLKYKMLECKKVYGIWGSFVSFWFPRFFDLTRFALGRFQYEDMLATEEYSAAGYHLKYGDTVINLHIPSSGPLDDGEMIESLRKAAAFYADCFPDGVAKFTCHSWLLNPNHRDLLSPTCGINRFANLFDVVNFREDEKKNDLWRIFGKRYEGSTEDFPADTSLQRAYLKMVEDGTPIGWGTGFLFLKDGEIINRK